MDIVVLAGGLSAERDVSFKTGDMVANALRKNGHRVILLDVYLGYKEQEEDVTGLFAQSVEGRPIFFLGLTCFRFARWPTLCFWRSMGRTGRTESSRRRLTCLAYAIPGAAI